MTGSPATDDPAAPGPAAPEDSQSIRQHRALGHTALPAWGIADADLTLLSRSENHMFRVDLPDGSRRVLRIHRPHRRQPEVDSELAWLDALRRDTDLVVPAPVPTTSGTWSIRATSTDLPEARPCVLFGWLDGIAVPEPLTTDVLAELGALLAQLHAHARGFEPGPGFARPRLEPSAFAALHPGIVRSERLTPTDRATCAAALARIHAELRALGTDPEVVGLIHGDLHVGNCLRVGSRLAPIDFDDCQFAPLAYDLAVPLDMAAERPDPAPLEFAVLDGYRSVRPLHPRVAAVLPACRAARQIHLVGWLSENLDNPFLAEWADDYIPRSLAALAAFTRD